MYSDPQLQQYSLPDFANGKTQGVSINPYLATLIDPANNVMRIPDEYSNQTALYSSRSFFDVYGNTSSSTLPGDIGKFSFIIRPVIGANPTTIYSAQVANYDSNAQWVSTAFPNPIAYSLYSDSNLPFLIGSNGTNGIVREVRPVAMSAWFQYTAPSITLGGHVACALTDGNVGNYYADPAISPMAGCPLQEYRNLSTLPNSYNGKIIDGCYAFYKPFDTEDVAFNNAHHPYDSMLDYGATHTYPAIIISGQVMSTTGTYAGVIGRIQVDIIFEYVTFSRLVQSLPSDVNPPLMWNARLALQNVRTCMANDEHESFFKRALGYAKNLAGKAAPYIGSALGGLVGGPAGVAAGRTLGNGIASMLAPRVSAAPVNSNISSNRNTQKQKRNKNKKNIKKKIKNLKTLKMA